MFDIAGDIGPVGGPAMKTGRGFSYGGFMDGLGVPSAKM